MFILDGMVLYLFILVYLAKSSPWRDVFESPEHFSNANKLPSTFSLSSHRLSPCQGTGSYVCRGLPWNHTHLHLKKLRHRWLSSAGFQKSHRGHWSTEGCLEKQECWPHHSEYKTQNQELRLVFFSYLSSLLQFYLATVDTHESQKEIRNRLVNPVPG